MMRLLAGSIVHVPNKGGTRECHAGLIIATTAGIASADVIVWHADRAGATTLEIGLEQDASAKTDLTFHWPEQCPQPWSASRAGGS